MRTNHGDDHSRCSDFIAVLTYSSYVHNWTEEEWIERFEEDVEDVALRLYIILLKCFSKMKEKEGHCRIRTI